MIFERLILENVGVYAGRNTIELLPPSRDQPIILIGGLNGGGKTTLLESILLGFYGRNASWSHRGKQPYRDYLRELINHGANPSEGSCIEIHFNRMVDGRPHRYALARAWRLVDGNVQEFVTVERNGELDPVLSEHWEEYIESYLPAKLANLFFFDGEQIKELADRESASRILSIAVQTLLGLDLVSSLADDLSVLERRKKLAAKSDEERGRIEVLRTEFETAERNASIARNEGRAFNTDLLRLQEELRELQKRYRKEGGELFDSQDELKANRVALQANLTKAETTVREIAAGAAPLLLAIKQIEEVEIQAEAESEIRHERIVAQAEKTRDASIIKDLRSKLTDKNLRVVQDSLERFRPKRVHEADSLFLHAEEDFPEDVRTLLKTVLPGVREEFRQAHDAADSAREAMARIRQQIEAIPDADALAGVRREIGIREAQIRDTESKLTIQKERLRQAEAEERNRQKTLEAALGGMAAELEAIEFDQRILARIPRVQETLQQFREKVVARHAAKLERLILASFHQLLRKRDLVKELRINPVTFDLELFAPDGRTLTFERLSAGERQLLATAILWGLAKASGRPLPMIIDTPLGRLDSSHRRHLVERYFPVVSHQVILLSTDQEIDERTRAMLHPFIGRTYRLAFQDETRTTQVEEGYFFTHEAAS